MNKNNPSPPQTQWCRTTNVEQLIFQYTKRLQLFFKPIVVIVPSFLFRPSYLQPWAWAPGASHFGELPFRWVGQSRTIKKIIITIFVPVQSKYNLKMCCFRYLKCLQKQNLVPLSPPLILQNSLPPSSPLYTKLILRQKTKLSSNGWTNSNAWPKTTSKFWY